jgi:sugar/nucleoside kinase (ribokinase family)
MSAGGSLTNTLVAIARLSAAHGQPMRIAMGGATGADVLGSYYNAQLEAAGVQIVGEPQPGAGRGCRRPSAGHCVCPSEAG